MLPINRFEIKLVGNVEIGRNGLGITVDHDRLITAFLDGQQTMHTAVVEFDALPDPVWPRSKDYDLRLLADLALVGMSSFESAVKIGRFCLEFGGAGIHHLIHTRDARGLPFFI